MPRQIDLMMPMLLDPCGDLRWTESEQKAIAHARGMNAKPHTVSLVTIGRAHGALGEIGAAYRLLLHSPMHAKRARERLMAAARQLCFLLKTVESSPENKEKGLGYGSL